MWPIGCRIGRHASNQSLQSKNDFLINDNKHIFLFLNSREWKFAHPINRSVREQMLYEEEEELAAKEAEKALIEKKRARYLLLTNCASFILGMGM